MTCSCCSTRWDSSTLLNVFSRDFRICLTSEIMAESSASDVSRVDSSKEASLDRGLEQKK